MFENYEQLLSWLNKFIPGQQIHQTLSNLISAEQEKGFLLSHKEDRNINHFSFFIFNEKHFIVAEINIDEKDNNNCYSSIDIHNNVLTKKSVKFNNYDYSYSTNSNIFKDIEYTFNFEDGYNIIINQKDYEQKIDNFVNNLIKQ